jgi:rare lipoprotein A
MQEVRSRAAAPGAGYNQVGMASWYGPRFHGRRTANGETFDSNLLTAAHPSLPIPSYARVTNLDNNRSVTVRINDRGPFAHNRLIDVSERAAEVLAFRRHGLTRVRVEYVSAAPPARRGGSEVAYAERRRPRHEPTELVTTPQTVFNRILMAFNVASTAKD